MGCAVTFHDHVGRDQLEAAIEPITIRQLHELLESAIGETVHLALDRGDCEVEVTLSGDTEMERLNFDHMGDRSSTDVLAFPLHEWSVDGRHSHLADDDGFSPPGATLLGDVVVDVDQAVRQASAGDWSVAEEIVLLAIHGTLHLLGHDHAEMDEEVVMRSLEHDVLAAMHRRHREVSWKPGSLFDRAGHAVTTGS